MVLLLENQFVIQINCFSHLAFLLVFYRISCTNCLYYTKEVKNTHTQVKILHVILAT